MRERLPILRAQPPGQERELPFQRDLRLRRGEYQPEGCRFCVPSGAQGLPATQDHQPFEGQLHYHHAETATFGPTGRCLFRACDKLLKLTHRSLPSSLAHSLSAPRRAVHAYPD